VLDIDWSCSRAGLHYSLDYREAMAEDQIYETASPCCMDHFPLTLVLGKLFLSKDICLLGA
jgi:hypothetical protein